MSITKKKFKKSRFRWGPSQQNWNSTPGGESADLRATLMHISWSFSLKPSARVCWKKIHTQTHTTWWLTPPVLILNRIKLTLEGVEEEEDEEEEQPSPSSLHKMTTTLEISMISANGYKSRHSQPECGYALEPSQWTEYSIHTMDPDNLELTFEFFEVLKSFFFNLQINNEDIKYTRKVNAIAQQTKHIQ